MAAPSMAKHTLPAKKWGRGLTIARASLTHTTIPIASGAAYAILIALLLGAIAPSLAQVDIGPYLSSNVIAGMLGGHVTHLGGITITLAIYLYSAFYGLLFGGIIANVSGGAIPLTIENGTLDLALSRPISRTHFYLENWGAMLLAAVILSLLTVFASWFATLFLTHPDLDWQWLWITQGVQSAFLFFAAGLGMLLGSFVNASRTAGWSAVGIIALGYLLNTFGGLSDKYSWLLKISPFYYAPGIDPLVYHHLTWWYPAALMAASLVLGSVGLIVFNKRDLPTT
jgi:ABC-type transport system involved in multi-copper enzyme maturation permease subunit